MSQGSRLEVFDEDPNHVFAVQVSRFNSGTTNIRISKGSRCVDLTEDEYPKIIEMVNELFTRVKNAKY